MGNEKSSPTKVKSILDGPRSLKGTRSLDSTSQLDSSTNSFKAPIFSNSKNSIDIFNDDEISSKDMKETLDALKPKRDVDLEAAIVETVNSYRTAHELAPLKNIDIYDEILTQTLRGSLKKGRPDIQSYREFKKQFEDRLAVENFAYVESVDVKSMNSRKFVEMCMKKWTSCSNFDLNMKLDVQYCATVVMHNIRGDFCVILLLLE